MNERWSKLIGLATSLPAFLPPSQIEDGEVHASLDQLGSRVSFTESPESYDNLHMVTNMDHHLAECISLEDKLSSFEKEMAADPRYIQRVSDHCASGEV